MKLGVQPDRVLQSMLNDRMVAKGLILQYATTFFQVSARPCLQHPLIPGSGGPDRLWIAHLLWLVSLMATQQQLAAVALRQHAGILHNDSIMLQDIWSDLVVVDNVENISWLTSIAQKQAPSPTLQSSPSTGLFHSALFTHARALFGSHRRAEVCIAPS